MQQTLEQGEMVFLRWCSRIFLCVVIVALALGSIQAQTSTDVILDIISAQQDAYGAIDVRFTLLRSMGAVDPPPAIYDLQLTEITAGVHARLSSIIEIRPTDLTPIDMVLIIDLTNTMSEEISFVQEALQEMITSLNQTGFQDLRLGIVLFDSDVQNNGLQPLSSVSLPSLQVSNDTAANSNVLLDALNSGVSLFTDSNRRRILFMITDATGTAEGQSLLQPEQFYGMDTFIVPVSNATDETFRGLRDAIHAVVFPPVTINPNSLQSTNPFAIAVNNVIDFTTREYQLVASLSGQSLAGQIALQLGLLDSELAPVAVSNVMRLDYVEPDISVQLNAPTSSPLSGNVTGSDIPLVATIQTTAETSSYQYRFVIQVGEESVIEICSRSAETTCTWRPAALSFPFPYGTYPFLVQVYDFAGTLVTVGGPLILNYYDSQFLQVDMPAFLRGSEALQVRFANDDADTAILYWVDGEQERYITEAPREADNTAILSFVTSDTFFSGQPSSSPDIPVHLRIDAIRRETGRLVSQWESPSVVASAAGYTLNVSEPPSVSQCQIPGIPSLTIRLLPEQPVRSGLAFIVEQRLLMVNSGSSGEGEMPTTAWRDLEFPLDPAAYPSPGRWEITVTAIDETYQNREIVFPLAESVTRRVNIVQPLSITGDILQANLSDSTNITIPILEGASVYGINFLADGTNEWISVVQPSILQGEQSGFMTTEVLWQPVFDHFAGRSSLSGQACIYLQDVEGTLLYNWVEERTLKRPGGIPLFPNGLIWVALVVGSIGFARLTKPRQLLHVASWRKSQVYPVGGGSLKTRFPEGSLISIKWSGLKTASSSIQINNHCTLDIAKREFLYEPVIAFNQRDTSIPGKIGKIEVTDRQTVAMTLDFKNRKDIYIQVKQNSSLGEFINWANANGSYDMRCTQDTLTLTSPGTYTIVYSTSALEGKQNTATPTIWGFEILIL